MKKQILAGLFIISAISFALPPKGQTPGVPRHIRHFEYFHHDGLRIGRALEYLPPHLQKEFDLTNLNIEEKEIAVKKLLLEEKIDWNKISGINREIAILRADLKTKLQQYFIENPIPEPVRPVPLAERKPNPPVEEKIKPIKKL